MRIYKNGFSLVELVVSLTIILLLTGIGVTTFSGLMKSKKVSTVRSELASWLSLSRNLAVTGQLPNKDLGLKFVRVTFSNNQFVIEGVDNAQPPNSPMFVTKTFSNDLDVDDVTISITNNNVGISSFGFNKGSGRLLDIGGTMIDGPVKILISSGGVGTSLTINDLGIINEK